MNKNIIITDEDIDIIENKLLRQKGRFDSERRNAIKYTDNVDIIACAGSGKTTLMCAKIDILTKKLLQTKSEKGIAVLSLTNVAVDEIKRKLGENHKLFQYPNCCKTIQKFVGEYIFKNWYISKFHKKIEIIDDDFCEMKLKEKINMILKTKMYTLEKRDFNFKEVYTDGIEIYCKDSNIENINLGMRETTEKEYKDAIISAKEQLIKEGIFNYKDVFIIALKYINKNSLIKKYMENRFECIIIDEMQDVREWEYNVIKELFKNVTFQKIGDPNQQIYDKTIWEINNELKIKNSLRNSINIAKFANNFEVQNTSMKGTVQNNIKVKFIIFNDSNIDKVKEVFGKEIIKNKLDEKQNAIFKMIGAVKKQHATNITLYNYINQKVQMVESSKLEYILKNNLDKYNIYKAMLETLYKAYKFVDIKNYANIESKESFFEEVEKYIDKGTLLKNIKKDASFGNLCELQKIIIKYTLGKIINEEYLDNRIEHFYKHISDIKIENTDSDYFILNNDGKKIKIDYGTINSVKGETHTATLVCETFNKYYDIANVFEKHIKLHKKLKTTENFLHKLYVGFTRPTDMICVAITNDTYNKFKKEIKDLDIEIIYLGDDENETGRI